MTIDSITLKRIDLAHPALRDELHEIYGKICLALTGNVTCRFTHTLRTFSEQNALYAKGRTMPGKKVTIAKAGQSYHNYGMAVDFTLIKDGKAIWERGEDFDGDKLPDWMEVVSIFKSYGWAWGGDFKSIKDYPHFEKSFGHSTNKLQFKPKINGTLYPIL